MGYMDEIHGTPSIAAPKKDPSWETGRGEETGRPLDSASPLEHDHDKVPIQFCMDMPR